MKVAVVAKLKHGALWAGLKRKEWSQSDLARALGLDPTTVGRWVMMTGHPIWEEIANQHSPRAKTLSEEQRQLLEQLAGVPIEEIWPPEVRTKQFLEGQRMFETVAKVDIRRLAGARGVKQLESPAQIIESHEAKEAIEALMKTLPEREQKVLERRVDGETLGQIAKDFCVTKETIRNIEKKALNRLRHPANRDRLNELTKVYN